MKMRIKVDEVSVSGRSNGIKDLRGRENMLFGGLIHVCCIIFKALDSEEESGKTRGSGQIQENHISYIRSLYIVCTTEGVTERFFKRSQMMI